MADENNTIRLNPTKASTLEFDVTVSGLENITPTVRFVIENASDGIDWVVNCSKLEGSKWQASFPAFKDFKLNTCKFCVEVIVDEYFFKPAEGEIIFINSPDVSFTPKVGPKPSVTTSFTVKQDDKPVKPKKKKVSEAASGGPEVTGQFAPNNSLLKPEENPEDTHGKVKVAQAELDDQFIEKEKLDDMSDEEPIPGDGRQYPQPDGKRKRFKKLNDLVDDTSEQITNNIQSEEFDPKKVAEGILQATIGMNKPTIGTLRGSLFKRDASGKIVVPGLESQQQLQEKATREQKVKDILK